MGRQQQIDVARRLVAHPKWQWRAGTRVHDDHGDFGRIRTSIGGRILIDWESAEGQQRTWDPISASQSLLPDLEDPGTSGVLTFLWLAAISDRSRRLAEMTVAQRDEMHRYIGAAMCDPEGITAAEAMLGLWASR